MSPLLFVTDRDPAVDKKNGFEYDNINTQLFEINGLQRHFIENKKNQFKS